MRKIHAVRVLTAAVLIALAGTAGARGLEARIDPVLDKAAAGTGQVRYTITNTGDTSVLVLRWQTALNGVDDNLFSVSHDGQPSLYVGKHFKRGLPLPEDYIEIAAGESKSAIVDLSTYYDMRTAGQYAVKVDTDLQFAFEEDLENHAKLVPAQEKLASAATFVWVDGAHTTPEPDLSWLAGAKGISYTGCSNTRQSALSTAWGSSKTYATNAKNYLNAGNTGARYTTWFGTYLSSRYSTVRSHFVAIEDALYNKSIVFDCTCTDSAYAYVYPTQPYKIYLCNAFWSAPNTGTDSRAGTIIHETSHFNVVAGTDDWAYGQTAAKNLARSNPKKAVDNADSHEYFAENTPSQN
ncbi:MAG TPA: M35 family metallo-endopeptidase [Xanthomonadales bacterium]|nr:M35 family metallo-endopeptidase [Xanthomonadales bacterium]